MLLSQNIYIQALIGSEYSFSKVNDSKSVKSIVWYRLITMTGSSVLMSRANNTKLSIWVTVFELVAVSLFIGSIISTDHGLSPILEKMKKKSWNIYSYLNIIYFIFLQKLCTYLFFCYFDFGVFDFCCMFVL